MNLWQWFTVWMNLWQWFTVWMNLWQWFTVWMNLTMIQSLNESMIVIKSMILIYSLNLWQRFIECGWRYDTYSDSLFEWIWGTKALTSISNIYIVFLWMYSTYQFKPWHCKCPSWIFLWNGLWFQMTRTNDEDKWWGQMIKTNNEDK